jgi:hypothetical protein
MLFKLHTGELYKKPLLICTIQIFKFTWFSQKDKNIINSQNCVYKNSLLYNIYGLLYETLYKQMYFSKKSFISLYVFLFSSPGHRPCELLSWVSVHRPFVSFSHLNLLLWNRWTDFNQTCQKYSLDGSLPVNDHSCIVTIQLAGWFLTRFLKFQPMRTHYGPWQPCWISNQYQKHKSGRGPSNKHFWQVWLKSVLRFQRRIELWLCRNDHWVVLY